MPSFVTPIQLLCGDHAFDSRSVELKLDGVTLEMSAADVLLVRKANNGVVIGAYASLQFHRTSHRHSIEGLKVSAKFATLVRLSMDKFHAHLRFQSMDRLKLNRLKRFAAERH